MQLYNNINNNINIIIVIRIGQTNVEVKLNYVIPTLVFQNMKVVLTLILI